MFTLAMTVSFSELELGHERMSRSRSSVGARDVASASFSRMQSLLVRAMRSWGRRGTAVASRDPMQTPLQITFRGIESTEPIETYVRTRADKLERFSDRITGCHVMIEKPHRHKRHGQHYRIRIELVVPGDELVVARDPAERKDHEDLYATLDAAFDDAQRVLEDHVRTQRGSRRRAPS
jgi:ribosomal subunit interface protein